MTEGRRDTVLDSRRQSRTHPFRYRSSPGMRDRSDPCCRLIDVVLANTDGRSLVSLAVHRRICKQ